MSPTTEAMKAQAAEVRTRAGAMHKAADQADATRTVEHGGARDDAAREAWGARQQAKAAEQQIKREQKNADDLKAEAEGYDQEAATSNDEVMAETLREMAQTRRSQATAASERVQRAEHARDTDLARAETLDQRVAELEQMANDSSVAIAVNTAANQLDDAARQLDEKVRMHEIADNFEASAAEQDAKGNADTAEHFRKEAAASRAEAEAVEVKLPEIDSRILAAAGVDENGAPLPTDAPAPETPVDEEASLRAEVEELRAQARELHEKAVEAKSRTEADDAAERYTLQRQAQDAQGARDGAKSAALEAHEKAKGLHAEADQLEKDAAEKANDFDFPQKNVEELRELAVEARASARNATRLAEQAETEAVQQTARAAEAARTLDEFERRPPADVRHHVIETAADQLDDKARLLVEAADRHVAARNHAAMGDDKAAAESLQKAEALEAEARAIQPSGAADLADPSTLDELGVDAGAIAPPTTPRSEQEQGSIVGDDVQTIDPVLDGSPNDVELPSVLDGSPNDVDVDAVAHVEAPTFEESAVPETDPYDSYDYDQPETDQSFGEPDPVGELA